MAAFCIFIKLHRILQVAKNGSQSVSQGQQQRKLFTAVLKSDRHADMVFMSRTDSNQQVLRYCFKQSASTPTAGMGLPSDKICSESNRKARPIKHCRLSLEFASLRTPKPKGSRAEQVKQGNPSDQEYGEFLHLPGGKISPLSSQWPTILTLTLSQSARLIAKHHCCL